MFVKLGEGSVQTGPLSGHTIGTRVSFDSSSGDCQLLEAYRSDQIY